VASTEKTSLPEQEQSSSRSRTANSPQWHRDEEYRQSVIRKALLLGFSCEEYRGAHKGDGSLLHPKWSFNFEGARHEGYASCYSAAFDYLRLLKIPPEVIGDYRG
jgi:hypothetical protein